MEVTKEHWTNVCKIGQGNDCCRYLIVSPDGFECARDDVSMKKILDDRVLKMKAQGDNCKGWDSYQKTLNS